MTGHQPDPGTPTDPPTWPARLFRLGLRLAVIALVLYTLHLLMVRAEALIADGRADAGFAILFAILVVYALLLAVPFVPGIEVGLALLMLQGSAIAPLVYLATVAGLLVAFLAGAILPPSLLQSLFADLGLRRAAAHLGRLGGFSRAERVALLHDRLPARLRPLVQRYRYLLVAVLINTPGNAVIGGGGGILFLAGLSRLFHPAAMIVTLLMAVLPVPLAVWFLGTPILD